MESSVSTLLQDLADVSDLWAKNARFCAPRVIFHFPKLEGQTFYAGDGSSLTRRQAQEHLEEKIFRVSCLPTSLLLRKYLKSVDFCLFLGTSSRQTDYKHCD